VVDRVRIVILTGHRRGAPSDYLPTLCAHPAIEVVRVVLSENRVLDRRKMLARRWRKLRQIGLPGALVGLYLRRWDDASDSEDLFEVARRYDIPVECTPAFNCNRTRELVRSADADLGLALGTAILGPRLFEIPRHGTINVHGAILPRFRGGASVLWEIHEGFDEVGFSIHRIDRGIDTGPILYVESFPMQIESTLRETYRVNVGEIRRRVPKSLANVVANLSEFEAKAQAPEEGTRYTTPTLGQFLRMLRMHRKMRRAVGSKSTADP
jgi:methionyl-tRNA formyltransferase